MKQRIIILATAIILTVTGAIGATAWTNYHSHSNCQSHGLIPDASSPPLAHSTYRAEVGWWVFWADSRMKVLHWTDYDRNGIYSLDHYHWENYCNLPPQGN